jgi:hypothetical protein
MAIIYKQAFKLKIFATVFNTLNEAHFLGESRSGHILYISAL